MADILLIGAGPMAVQHYKAARALDLTVTVCGRGEASADAFEAETGMRPGTGELQSQLEAMKVVPARALVAVSVAQLGDATRAVLAAGCERVLLEKPGGATLEDVEALASGDGDDRVRLAYNRRFLPSVLTAADCIASDGGLTSMMFEFNENRSLVAGLTQHTPAVKANWFFANSTHVVDTAFFLAGYPSRIPDHEMAAFANGDAAALPPSQAYGGAGRIGDVVYAFHADWSSAGRWGIELCTPRRRLVLKPVETLSEMPAGSFRLNELALSHGEPSGLKPGLFNMLAAFQKDPDQPAFLSLKGQADRLRCFRKFVGG
ncbi:Gfo/Idh/MocA family oxidoreductase [Glycocaulis abyssi]|uniref:Gfo/Idh/MocA family oxidoreductase n=1 Tax=Glycocaulis abyssi TaxID=1433403 RepID=A0ABV9NCQ8_9PROT